MEDSDSKIPPVRFWIGTAIGIAAAMLAVNAAGEVYESVVERDDLAAFDRPVHEAVLSMRVPELTNVIAFYSNLGGGVIMPILTTIVAGLLAWWLRSWDPIVVVAFAAAGSLLMTVAGKPLVGRARPPWSEAIAPFESSASFPSGHTLNATVVAGILMYFAVHDLRNRRLAAGVVTFGVVFVVTMGLSRVYLGHHWLTDVVVGWLLGIAWCAVVLTGYRWWRYGHPLAD